MKAPTIAQCRAKVLRKLATIKGNLSKELKGISYRSTDDLTYMKGYLVGITHAENIIIGKE